MVGGVWGSGCLEPALPQQLAGRTLLPLKFLAEKGVLELRQDENPAGFRPRFGAPKRQKLGQCRLV